MEASSELDPNEIGDTLDKINACKLKLKMITNRGVKVYPNGLAETYCTDHWRCRFVGTDAEIESVNKAYAPIDYEQVIALLSKLSVQKVEVIKTENLYEFEGRRGFSLG